MPETTLTLLKKSAAFFEEKGISEARRSAELLLAHSLGQKRLNLYLLFERPVSDEELDAFRALVRRRLNHEPVQYIVGSTEFYAMEFRVTPAVLIPRPETEHLVEAALDHFKSVGDASAIQVLDIGTGSGIIPSVLCAKVPACSCTAIDISAEALEIARENAGRHGCDGRVAFLKQDIMTDVPPEWEQAFDLVVSNPPYIPAEEIAGLQPEIRSFEPLVATTDNADGLSFYRRIAELAPKLLKPGGRVMVEIGYGQSEEVQTIFTRAGMSVDDVIDDYSGIPRVLISRSA